MKFEGLDSSWLHEEFSDITKQLNRQENFGPTKSVEVAGSDLFKTEIRNP